MTDFMDVKLVNVTKQEYVRQLKVFFNFLQLQGNLDEQSRAFLTQARKDRIWAQDGLKYYIRAAKKRAEAGEIVESTIRNLYKPVRLFCSIHDIELSWKKITDIIPTGRRVANDRAPTVEEIQRLIAYPDRRIKPLVFTTCSSGIRVGAWEYLKWKHIEPIIRVIGDGDTTFETLKWNHEPVSQQDKVIVAAKITVYAGENEQYFSFITPEAFEVLDEWMRYRKSGGEDINGESWLMRQVWDTTTPKSTIKKSPEKMSTDAIEQLIKRAWRSQGLRTALDMKVTRRYEVKAVHGFRKFFRTYAEPKIGSLNAMIMMGQDVGLSASYNKPTEEMLLMEYLKAVDNLTIDKTRTKQQQQDKKMVDFATKQQALAVQLETKDQEIQGLRKQTQILTEAYKGMEERRESKDQEMQALRNELLETKEAQQKKDDEMKVLKEHMARMEESQLKITELLEVMKIAKSSDGKVGRDRTMLDEKRRVTIGYIDDNNQSVEMKVPLDGFEIDEAGVDAVS
jgi:integrase